MWHDFFVNLWLKMFGTLEFGGVNIGFWVAMLVCVLLVVAMNLVFWLMKPKGGKDLREGGGPDDDEKRM